jgi:enamine deaminase RidA (YjgF/YER057c/UK114 family)
MKRHALILPLLALLAAPAFGKDVIRYKLPTDFPIAQAVEIPAGQSLIFLSGVGPEVVDKTAPADSVTAYGDMKTQARSVLTTIAANLKSMGLEVKDVVKMQVFMVGDAANGGKLDFAGFMDSYRQFFGTPAQPNLPARSAMKVAGLVNPGWLIEIEVAAVRK